MSQLDYFSVRSFSIGHLSHSLEESLLTGCEKRITQLLPMNSWKSIGPVVVSALKFGAMDPRRRLSGQG